MGLVHVTCLLDVLNQNGLPFVSLSTCLQSGTKEVVRAGLQTSQKNVFMIILLHADHMLQMGVASKEFAVAQNYVGIPFGCAFKSLGSVDLIVPGLVLARI